MPVSLVSPIAQCPLAFFDVETTGSSPAWGDRVTELGILRVDPDGTATRYQQLVDPQRRIGPGVVALTGITQAMVDGQPTFADVKDACCSLLRDAVVVGHNVRFDLGFLSAELRRAGSEIGSELAGTVVLDTVRIARRRYGRGGNGLQVLSRRLGIEPTTAHRALADAETTAAVLAEMLQPVGGGDLMLADVVRLQGGAMSLAGSQPRGGTTLPLELTEAIEAARPVRMTYLDARQKQTERVIKPIEVRKYRGEMMLLAYCQLRNDRRTFRLDRIVRLVREEAG